MAIAGVKKNKNKYIYIWQENEGMVKVLQ